MDVSWRVFGAVDIARDDTRDVSEHELHRNADTALVVTDSVVPHPMQNVSASAVSN